MKLSMVLDKIRALRKKVDTQADDYIVALDIGTEYIKALIANVQGEDIEIVGVGRAHQELGDMHQGAIADIAGVVRNCEEALGAAEEEAGLQAKRAVIGIVRLTKLRWNLSSKKSKTAPL